MRTLRTINLIIAFITTTAPMAHALEMLSKFKLDGPLWLNVQQHLYRGWGEAFGPVEMLALLTTVILLVMRWGDLHACRAYLIAALCYAAMLIDFFIFNQPVNQAVNGWTIDTLPTNWSTYRIQWEVGHALTALFSVIAFVALIRQHTIAEE
jgi:Anthrone oxygenase